MRKAIFLPILLAVLFVPNLVFGRVCADFEYNEFGVDLQSVLISSSNSPCVLGSPPYDSLTPINQSNIPFSTTTGLGDKYPDDLVDGGYDVTIKPEDIITRGPRVDVRAYGAIGDGTTDDTTAIQAAHDSLSSGGVLYFPSGDYLISTQILLGIDDVTIEGDGYKSKIFHTGNINLLRANAARNNITIKKLRLVGNSSGTSNQDGISFNLGAVNILIEDCWIEDNAYHGIAFNNQGASNVRIINNVILNNGMSTNVTIPGAGIMVSGSGVMVKGNYIARNGANGIDTATCPDSVISNNICSNNGRSTLGTATDDRNGIYIGGGGSRNTTVSGNVCNGNGDGSGNGNGIKTSGGPPRDYIITGNVCNDNKKHGIEATGSGAVGGGIVVGNLTTGNAKAGIYISGGGSIVSDNRVVSNGVHGINVQANYCLISNNVCLDNTGKGILIIDDYVTVQGNLCKNWVGTSQTYGIEVAATANQTRVIHNYLYSNDTGFLLDNGTNTVDIGNITSSTDVTYKIKTGIAFKYNSAGAVVTLDTNDFSRWAIADSGAFTINLLAIADINPGQIYLIIKDDTTNNENAITIDPNGSEKINGGTTYILNQQYDAVLIIADDVEWFIIAEYKKGGDVTIGTTVASATELNLGDGKVFSVTGTTTITSIAAADTYAGREIILIFTGSLTFADGSNLKLEGNFSTSADDTISLICLDGTNWLEVSRAAN